MIKKHVNLSQVKFINSDKRNENLIIETITNLEIDCLISIQHPWKLSKNVIDEINGFCFNIHNGKIPKYSGFNSLSHHILNNEKYLYSTLHWIEEEIDQGEIISEIKTHIQKSDTSLSLYLKSLDSIVALFNFLLHSIKNDLYPKIQKSSIIHFYSRDSLEKYRNLLKLSNILKVRKIIRALHFPPRLPPFIYINKKKFYIVDEEYFLEINKMIIDPADPVN